jgi:CheY-like chemotaxis protein
LARSEADGLAWSPDPQSSQPVPTPTTAALAAQRRVVDQSRLLNRLGNLSSSASLTAVTADLAYRFQVDPLAVPDQIDELRQLWGDEMFTARSLSMIIGSAIDDDDLAAAVAAMSLVGPSNLGDRRDLLTTGSAALAPLVAAVQHSVPQVRFEAALAVMRLEPRSAFPGASIVIDRLNEMAALTRSPIALIVDTRVERESQIERLIASMGYRVEVANSVSGAIHQVALGGDLRLVISTSILPDRSVLELVDGVRRHPFGRQAAIFIHGPYDSSIQVAVDEKRWDKPVFHIELPNSAAGWGVLLEPVVDQPVGRLQGFDPLSAAQRFEFRRQAVIAIGKLTSDPELYDFFGIERLVGASLGTGSSTDPEVAKVAFGDPRLALLSASANGQSQAALVEMMLRQSAKQAENEAAAKALRVSIDRHGVLMSSDVVRRLGVVESSMDAGPQQQAVAEIVELIANRFGFIVVGAGD